jgi:hypothetical protein
MLKNVNAITVAMVAALPLLGACQESSSGTASMDRSGEMSTRASDLSGVVGVSFRSMPQPRRVIQIDCRNPTDVLTVANERARETWDDFVRDNSSRACALGLVWADGYRTNEFAPGRFFPSIAMDVSGASSASMGNSWNSEPTLSPVVSIGYEFPQRSRQPVHTCEEPANAPYLEDFLFEDLRLDVSLHAEAQCSVVTVSGQKDAKQAVCEPGPTIRREEERLAGQILEGCRRVREIARAAGSAYCVVEEESRAVCPTEWKTSISRPPSAPSIALNVRQQGLSGSGQVYASVNLDPDGVGNFFSNLFRGGRANQQPSGNIRCVPPEQTFHYRKMQEVLRVAYERASRSALCTGTTGPAPASDSVNWPAPASPENRPVLPSTK